MYASRSCANLPREKVSMGRETPDEHTLPPIGSVQRVQQNLSHISQRVVRPVSIWFALPTVSLDPAVEGRPAVFEHVCETRMNATSWNVLVVKWQSYSNRTYGNVACFRSFQLLRAIGFDNAQIELNSDGSRLSMFGEKGTYSGYSLFLLTIGFGERLRRIVREQFAVHEKQTSRFRCSSRSRLCWYCSSNFVSSASRIRFSSCK